MSDNFTKMVNCPEIQDGWKKQHGDAVFCKPTGEIYLFDVSRLKFGYSTEHIVVMQSEIWWSTKKRGPWTIEQAVWLPTIEQLMGMVDMITLVKNKDGTFAVGTPIKFLEYESRVFLSKTAKEALIQAVMHELHDMKWDGERWIK